MRVGLFVFTALVASASLGSFTSQAMAQAAARLKMHRQSAVAAQEVYEPMAYQEAPEVPSVEEVPGSDQYETPVATDGGAGPNGDAYGGYCGSGGCDVAGCGVGGCDSSYCGLEGCCGSGCCDGGMCGCSNCCPRYGLSAGVEFTYLQLNVSDATIDEEFDWEAAPRVWIGYQGASGWGVRGRYWDFDTDQSFQAVSELVDDDPDQVLGATVFNQQIELYAADLELTKYFCVLNTDCWASFGARHARLHSEANLQLAIFDLSGGGGDDASVIAENVSRTFEGTGPTFGIDFRRQIMQSRFAALCNMRGSVLWGSNDLRVQGNVIEVIPVGAGDLAVNDFDDLAISGNSNKEMWVGELQAGGEWMVPIDRAYGGGNAFVRVMFEAQWWNAPGLDTHSEEIGQIGDNLNEFLGGTIAAGFVR